MSAPIKLTVELGPLGVDAHPGWLMEGLRSLWHQSELCDVELIAGGQSFLAHRPVLAAVSPSFHECLLQLSSVQHGDAASDKKKLVLTMGDITHPEAVQAMLECIYGAPADGTPAKGYVPSCDAANSDVLRLAQRFQIVQLQYQASRWLTSNLSTSNVLPRLLACEEFALSDVRDRILEQFIANPHALYALTNDPEIVKAPTVLQDLLLRVLRKLGCDSAEAPAAGTGQKGAPRGPQTKFARKGA